MTICKLFYNVTLKKNKSYRRAELIEDLQKIENRASTYYDPERKKLYTFFSEKNKNWKTRYENNILKFFHQNLQTVGNSAVWEETKQRHVFFQYKKNRSGYYTYLGTSVGETCKTVRGKTVREFQIH